MHKTLFILMAGAAMVASGGAQAQNIAKIGQKSDWALYSYNDDKGKVCYTLTIPTDKQPPTLDHGKSMYFVVSQKPGQNVTFEPQFNASYNFQENSKVEVTVGDRKFSMFTKGNRAWMENAAEEPQLVAALRKGSAMKVDAKSQRGTATHYTYSLAGVTAALQSIATCK
jgi:hypothetical protein